MYKLPLIFLLTFFYCTHAGAQTDTYADTVITPMDTAAYIASDDTYSSDLLTDTALRFRSSSLNKDSLQVWKNKKEYGWIKNLDSLLKDEQDRTRHKTQDIKKSDRSFGDWLLGSGILNIFFWVVAGMMVAFIIYRLFLSKGLFGRSSKKVIKENPDESETEDISGKDFNAELNKAYAAGDFRTATRWLFLMTLQKLDEKELIRFGADKTNTAYLNELPPAKKEEFASLALYYEYIWYGKAPLQKETFDMIRVKYNDFLNRI